MGLRKIAHGDVIKEFASWLKSQLENSQRICEFYDFAFQDFIKISYLVKFLGHRMSS